MGSAPSCTECSAYLANKCLQGFFGGGVSDVEEEEEEQEGLSVGGDVLVGRKCGGPQMAKAGSGPGGTRREIEEEAEEAYSGVGGLLFGTNNASSA